ncbi:MAG: 5'/3'-nucleotidase SurE [Myxococcota bacterium]
MRVLITNDDGLGAPGIDSLADAARGVFEEVWVVAPEREMSGVGQGITLHAPLRVNEAGARTWAVSGTPVDCVIVAMNHLMADRPPDLVLSGINRGPNLGHDVYYSGTVAGAREGILQGVPSVALSLVGRRRFPYGAVSPAVRALLRWVRDTGLTSEFLLNVNIPMPAEEDEAARGFAGVPGLRGLQVTRLGSRSYANHIISRDDPRGLPYMWIGGDFPKMEDVGGTDCTAVSSGYVSVTPVGLDTTHAPGFDGLRTLESLDPHTEEEP